jgi:hypothetical protein
MAEEGFKHKLTASLRTDAEGCSRLTGEDEEVTLSSLKPYRMPCFKFNPGILLIINSSFTPGAVFKAPFRAQLQHHYHSAYLWIFPTRPDRNQDGGIIFCEDESLDMPMSYKNIVYDLVYR